MQQNLQQGGFQDGGIFNDFTGCRSARENKNTSANDGADAESSQADPAKRFS
jgi:hypothetical protein